MIQKANKMFLFAYDRQLDIKCMGGEVKKLSSLARDRRIQNSLDWPSWVAQRLTLPPTNMKCKKALSKRKVVFYRGLCTSMLAGGRVHSQACNKFLPCDEGGVLRLRSEVCKGAEEYVIGQGLPLEQPEFPAVIIV